MTIQRPPGTDAARHGSGDADLTQIARSNGLSAGAEFFSWMLDGAPPDRVEAALAQLPPPLRLYRAVWKPRYAKVSHW